MSLTQIQNGMIATGAVTANVISFGANTITGNVIVTNSLSGNTLIANTVSNTSFQTGSVENYMSSQGSQLGGMRNKIINGDMRIDQRNAGASVTASTVNTTTYTLDRWAYYASQSNKYTVQQNAGGVTPPIGFLNYLGATSNSAYTVGSSEEFDITQTIEGLNISDLAWGTSNAKTVTLSFQVYSSLTGTFGGSLRSAGGSRSYPFSYTISNANTWTSISITIPGDTSGTWLTTNGVGIILSFGLGVGSSMSGTSGSWASANYVSSTGAVSVVGTSGAKFYITGVQLEKGSVATPFEYRQYGQELALCQRYYETVTLANLGGTGYALFVGAWNSLTNAYMTWNYKQTKRAIPTFALGSTASWQAPAPSVLAQIDNVTFGAGGNPTVISGTAGAIACSFSAEL